MITRIREATRGSSLSNNEKKNAFYFCCTLRMTLFTQKVSSAEAMLHVCSFSTQCASVLYCSCATSIATYRTDVRTERKELTKAKNKKKNSARQAHLIFQAGGVARQHIPYRPPQLFPRPLTPPASARGAAPVSSCHSTSQRAVEPPVPCAASPTAALASARQTHDRRHRSARQHP